MKVKLLHHSEEWLPGDFDAPEALRGQASLACWHIHALGASDRIAMKLERGAGVWDTSGRLLHYSKTASDMTWDAGSRTLLSLECTFGKCSASPGVRHALRRLDPESFQVVSEIDLCVRRGGVRYLVLDRSGRRCLATWLDENEWGYVVVDLESMRQTDMSFHSTSASLSPPGFAPNGDSIVACNFFRTSWWNDEHDDPAEIRSPGGLRKLSTISVQDVQSGTVSTHDLMVDLPAGWLPDRPHEGEWSTVWGPEFVSDRAFKIWLPDDSTEVIELPLPPTVVIPRTLADVRPWSD